MLKKLKLKFILITMALFSLVIIPIFSSTCVITYFSEEAQINTLLEESLLFKGSNPYLPPNTFEEENIPYAYVFTVLINNADNVMIVNGDEDISEDFIRAAVAQALEQEESQGKLLTLNLSYIKKENATGVFGTPGTLISFVSRENLQAKVRYSIITSSIATFISLLFFLYISKRLADYALKPIEQAWEQQKQFIADASHDLKTPLTVILANNNILASHKDESVLSQMKWIESTGEEATRMTALVNDMLELAQSEDTKQKLDFADTNVSQLLEGSILQFEVLAFEKSVLIESDIEADVIAKTHADTLSKILRILFENAIKYSPQGEKIKVCLSQSAQSVSISLTNYGEAIKAEDLPHIFERFYRTDKARKVGGHGLGLSIAKRLTETLNGKICVQSNEVDGTTFTLTIKK